MRGKNDEETQTDGNRRRGEERRGEERRGENRRKGREVVL